MALYSSCLLLQNVLHSSLRNPQTINIYRSISSVIYRKIRNKIKCVQYIYPSNIHTSLINFKRRKTAEERKSSRIIEYSPKSKGDIVDIWRNITLEELATVLNKDINYVYDLFLNKFDDPKISITDVKILQQAIHRSGRRMRIIGRPVDNLKEIIKRDIYRRPPPSKSELKPRPPVVTVMGHIDHGKTTLLDALRHSKVVDQEFGGITQHIGAFSVILDSGACITFLDTPGHAAFTAMRSRGACITDLVVLVVAADDGVMEQTLESIKMAKQARVPILVAINKIDSPKADVSRTERMLIEAGIQVENMGGDVQSIPISALKRQNLDQLTEALILQAELLEIGADPTGPAEAVVVESKIDKHRGKLCTVIIQRGTLKKGNVLVAGTSIGKVRTLKNDKGEIVQKAPPGYPVEIEGWKQLPQPGDQVLEVESERRAREVQKVREADKESERMKEDVKVIVIKEEQHNIEYKQRLELKRKLGRYKLRPEGPRKPEINQDDSSPSLNIVLRADVDGTLEAILQALDTYESENCKMDLVHYGVGSITETDLELAKIFKGVIYAFNVDLPENLKNKEENVPIKYHNVIYKLIEDVKEEINLRLAPQEVEEILGEANVLQVFEITQGRKKVAVAGCRCEKGLLKRIGKYRVERKGEVIHTGALSSMRHLKNEVDVIKADTECGLQFLDNDVKFEQGDVIICFEKKMVPQKTDWDPGF